MVEKMSGSGGSNSRVSNALLLRAESIKKWKTSETAREHPIRTPEQFTIQFDKGTVFLSAVASGDLDETEKLLDEGVDIDFRNNDGLTALHQACIDENDDMVNLLLDRGANIEAVDNEGWTPLHAAASAGNIDIAQILIENGADLSAVNNEGELPLDLAEEDEMEDFLSDEIDKQELEVEDARNEEREEMIKDATNWLNQNCIDEVLDWQGATSLHVAAAKGYNNVISTLLQIDNVDVNVRDNDGWTPLHAAVHWGSKSACELLTDAGGDFEIKNNNGQTPCDLAEPEFVKTAESCRKRSKDQAKKASNKKSNVINNKENEAIDLLNKQPPRSALKGGRERSKSKQTSSDAVVNNKNEETSDEEDEEEEREEEPPTKNTSSVRTTVHEVDTNKSSVRVNRLSRTDKDETKDNKTDSITATFNRTGVVDISRIKRDENQEKEETKTTRLPSRPINRISVLDSKSDNKPEEKKETIANRYTSRLHSNKDEKDDDNSILNRYRPRKFEDDRTRKKDENESSEPETKRFTSRTENESRGRTSNDEESSGRMSIAERLRKKNEELLANTSDRPLTERVSAENYNNRTRGERTAAINTPIGSIKDRNTRTSTTATSDTGDTKELQKKLDQALKEVDEYKSKYEKMKKEKEDLEKQLEQYKEDIDKMQELKNDNIRLKDENGALIRVISKLSRPSNSTTS